MHMAQKIFDERKTHPINHTFLVQIVYRITPPIPQWNGFYVNTEYVKR